MLRMWFSFYCNLDLRTLVYWTMGWGCLISHFWMGTCLNKLSCLVQRISSLVLWISCKVWSDIQTSLAPWFPRRISRCPRCAHLRHICANELILKNIEGVQFHCCHGNWWWWNLYLYIWSSLAFIPIWFHILLFFCMLGLMWNISSLILCVWKGSHILVMFGHERGQGYTWDVIVVLLDSFDCLALYDGHLGATDGLCSADVICGNQTVPNLFLLDIFF